ncbi:unnamed protein product [Cochlearia groenlandica]
MQHSSLGTQGLMKKLNELKILCGVDACSIIYNQFNSNPPEVWPSNSEASNVIRKFTMRTKTEQTFRYVNNEEFLISHIAKLRKQNQKLMEDHKERFMREVMFSCFGGKMGDFTMTIDHRLNLCESIDQYLKNLFHHINVVLLRFETGESSSMNFTNQTSENVDCLASNLLSTSDQEAYVPVIIQVCV